MKIRICPYCKEKIRHAAVVCRYCKKDIPGLQRRKCTRNTWIAAVSATAVIISGAAFLAAEFFRERRNWMQ